MKNHMNIVIDRYELAKTKWEIKYLNRIYIKKSNRYNFWSFWS